MDEQKLQEFILWLPTKFEEFQNKTPEESVQMLNELYKTNEGKQQIETLWKTFIQETQQQGMFAKGGKLDFFVEKYKGGGKTINDNPKGQPTDQQKATRPLTDEEIYISRHATNPDLDTLYSNPRRNSWRYFFAPSSYYKEGKYTTKDKGKPVVGHAPVYNSKYYPTSPQPIFSNNADKAMVKEIWGLRDPEWVESQHFLGADPQGWFFQVQRRNPNEEGLTGRTAQPSKKAKGGSIKKKCKCGCEIISVKEKGGVVEKCACGCQVKKKQVGGELSKRATLKPMKKFQGGGRSNPNAGVDILEKYPPNPTPGRVMTDEERKGTDLPYDASKFMRLASSPEWKNFWGGIQEGATQAAMMVPIARPIGAIRSTYQMARAARAARAARVEANWLAQYAKTPINMPKSNAWIPSLLFSGGLAGAMAYPFFGKKKSEKSEKSEKQPYINQQEGVGVGLIKK